MVRTADLLIPSGAQVTAASGARDAAVRDAFGRTFRSLRLSVTPACDLSCAYCNPARETFASTSRTPEFYLELVGRIHAATPLAAVHITGGEPTLYRRLPELVRGLRGLGVGRISMTTNGVRLAPLVPELRGAGLDDCNVSLDALSRRGFARMTGRDERDRVLSGIEACREAGLPVKVNCTVMRGRNERELLYLFEYMSNRSISVRFLELMNMGPLRGEHGRLLVPESEILDHIGKRHRFQPEVREAGSTARYWVTPDGRRFGIIANHSAPFCSDCDRLRLSFDGRLYGCLSSARSHSLDGAATESEVYAVLGQALAEKQRVFVGSEMNMQAIGG